MVVFVCQRGQLMMKRVRAVMTFFGMTACAIVAIPVYAGGSVGRATEHTQILNNLQLVASYAEQVEQTVTQISQYQTMLTNLMQLTPSGALNQAAQALWADQNMASAFHSLRRIVVAGQSTSYTLANIDHNFKTMHPGYGTVVDFQHAYRDWSDNTLDSVKNALTLVTAHADDFQSEAGMVNQLSTRSQTAQGQLQALQAGNDIGVAMVGQMQKLRQLQMAQMQAQNAYIGAQQSENDAKKTGLNKLYGSMSGDKLKK